MSSAESPGGEGQEERWEEVSDLFNEVVACTPAERETCLQRVCAGDDYLVQRIRSLLAAFGGAGDFLSQPLFSLHGSEEEESREWCIGPYRLGPLLGHGGMGSVYRAERMEGGFEQQVAIKLLKRGMDSVEILQRFHAERQILARLDHPHIARLLDGGTTEDGQPYFVMELVEGQPIDRYCDERHLGLEGRIALFQQVCAAVHFAHSNLVVHRDLKPANILVTGDGVPKLLDFGIAKLLQPDGDPIATGTGGRAPLTPHYASPEQVNGQPITTATDVYTLGVLLYELLTGHRPQELETLTPRHVEVVICEIEAPRPSTIVVQPGKRFEPGGSSRDLIPLSLAAARDSQPEVLARRLRGDLDTIVCQAMHKVPAERYSSAAQFAEDLELHLQGLPVQACPPTFTYRATKFVSRYRWSVTAVATIVFLSLGFGVAMAQQRAEIGRQNVEILRQQERTQTTKNLLIDFVTWPDPSRSKGEELTVREVLDAAQGRLAGTMEDEPELRAEVLDAVGGVYRNLELLSQAEPLLEEALSLRQEVYGEPHHLVAESLHNLASLRRRQSKFKVAEELMRQAVALQHRVFPGGHKDLARGLNNLASLLLRPQPQEAETLAWESLAMKRRLFGEKNLEVAVTLNTLATLLRRRGLLEQAESFYRESISIRREKEGATDPGLAKTLNNFALLLSDQGRLAEALQVHMEALQIRRRIFSGDHGSVVTSLNNLATVQLRLGDPAEAVPLLENAKAMLERLEKTDGRMSGKVLKNLALARGESGDPAACEDLAQEALSTFPASSSRSSLAEIKTIRGRCFRLAGRFEEAEPLLLEGLAQLGEHDASWWGTRQARLWVVELYESWGRPVEAAHFRAEERE